MITRREWAFLAFIFAYSFIPTFIGFLRIPELLGGATIIPPNPRAVTGPVPIILHIMASSIFCLIGALQFLPGFRRHRPVAHCALGRVVAIAGCVSALTGLWMTLEFTFPKELQGPMLYSARVALSVLMFGFIVQAVLLIRTRDVPAHRAAVLRAYAIGQGASTQAILFMITTAILGTELSGLPRDILMVLAWGLNLVIVETLIRRAVPLRINQAAIQPD